MDSPHIFPRTEHPRPQRGEWKPLWDRDHWSATICCPDCGNEATLTGHTIQESGLVSPSVVCPSPNEHVECPTEGCKFHVAAFLAAWPPLNVSIPPLT